MTTRPPKPVIAIPVLTQEQEAIRTKREEIDARVKVLREELEALKDTRPRCKSHVFSVGKVLDYEWFWSSYHKSWHLSTSVHCMVCGKRGGWYCPVNPTGQCQYDYEIDPLGDNCVHCGNPDERK